MNIKNEFNENSNNYENRRKGEIFMTREEHFEDIKVVKGNHWCEICDAEADFVIVDTTAYGIGRELPLCKKCAEMLKGKIDIGMKL